MLSLFQCRDQILLKCAVCVAETPCRYLCICHYRHKCHFVLTGVTTWCEDQHIVTSGSHNSPVCCWLGHVYLCMSYCLRLDSHTWLCNSPRSSDQADESAGLGRLAHLFTNNVAYTCCLASIMPYAMTSPAIPFIHPPPSPSPCHCPPPFSTSPYLLIVLAAWPCWLHRDWEGACHVCLISMICYRLTA